MYLPKLKKHLSPAVIIVLLLLAILVLTIPLSLFFVLLLPGILRRGKKQRVKYENFLTVNEGRGFFVYTDKKKTLDFIEQKIVTELSPNITTVLIRGRTIELNSQKQYFEQIKELLFRNRHLGKYPLIIWIKERRTLSISLNQKTYEAIKTNNPKIVLAVLIEDLSK